MKLTKVEITGFQGYQETHSFSFGMSNHIFGGRGEGKTALCEAIIWCFKGCDIRGSIKGIKKRLMNQKAKEMKVQSEIEFLNAQGQLQMHCICRKSTSRSSRLYLDGDEVTQTEIDALIGPTDLFLSIFSPGYLNGIAGGKLRSVLFSLLPELNPSDVVQTLSPEIQKQLSAFDLSDPLQRLLNLKGELEEWNEYVKDGEVRMDHIRMNIALQGSNEHVQEEEQKFSSLQEEIEKLQRAEPPVLPDYLSAWEEELAELGNQYRSEVAAWKTLKASAAKTGDLKSHGELEIITARCQKLLNDGFVIKKEIEKEHSALEEELADFHSRNNQELNMLAAELKTLEAKQRIRSSSQRLLQGLPKIQKQIDEGIQERNKTLSDISCLQEYMLHYAHMQAKSANQGLSRAEICFTVSKKSDGDYSLHYRLLYDKKEYYSLKSSEKFGCSFELSGLANKMLGLSIPVYIDNGDTMEDIKGGSTQFFVTSYVPHSELNHQIIVA